jgi:hypothetical protein
MTVAVEVVPCLNAPITNAQKKVETVFEVNLAE